MITTGTHARVWLVEADGSGDAPTIQGAIAASTSTDTIRIAVGTYYENLDTLGKSLTIQGAGSTVTIIDGGLQGSVLRLTGGGRVERLCLRNGQAFAGGGLHVSGPNSAMIRDNLVEDNFAGSSPDQGLGGGIFLDKATNGVVIEANLIRHNTARDEGGGVFDEGGYTVRNVLRSNRIADNTCYVAGAGVSTFSGLMEFNAIIRNHSEHFAGGVHVRADGVAEIRNNTIVRNTVLNFLTNGAGIHLNGGGVVRNNILAYNTYAGSFGQQSGAGIFCRGGSDAQVSCNDSWENDVDDVVGCVPEDASNFVADPLFCAREQDTYTLASKSPCLPPGSCGLIGAFGMGCGTTRVENHSWGGVKRLFR